MRNYKQLFFFLLVILLCSPISFINAQQLPNPGFENFEADAQNGTGFRPVGWKAANIRREVLGIVAEGKLIHEDPNGRNGKCVRIHNEAVGAAGIEENAPAWISLGTPWNFLDGINAATATAGTDGGTQFSYRPDTLSVWVRRTYTSRENAHIVVYLWKGTSYADSYKAKNGSCSTTKHYDEESDIRTAFNGNDCGTDTYATQIGEGMWRSDQQFNTWTEIKVPISYLNNETPEKMNIILSSGNYPNKRISTGINIGSTLYCDDIKFIYSSNASDLLLNNRPMAGFSSTTLDYTVSLGEAATSVPTIEPKRAGRKLSPSEYTINYAPIGQPTTITINAEDGSSSTTYSITFVSKLSKNPRPNGITIGTTPVPNFNPYVYTYSVELPYGTTTCPNIAVDFAEPGQTFTSVLPSAFPDTAFVTVFAPDNNFSQVYKLALSIGALTDNTLTGIFVNGNLVRNFSPTTNNYVVELPVGTTVDPVVTYTTAYPDEHVIVLTDNGLSGMGASIAVTPQGATNTRTYRLSYRITASSYSLLADLAVDGTTIPGFDPNTLSYDYQLPLGTTTIPQVSYIPGDEYQSIQLHQGSIDGETRIVVTAQSGAVSTYRINFSTVKSSISTLNNIFIDGTPIQGFSPSTTVYNVTLPIGTNEMPDITYERGDEYQTVTPYIGTLNSTSRLIVAAQNGDVTSYEIKFTVQQANISTLNDILVNGTSISNFNPDSLTYHIVLPRGTNTMPEITYMPADNTQTIRMAEGGLGGVTRITVKAQTGATSIYSLTFSVEKSSISTLNDILVSGTSITNFDPTILDYEIQLPSGTVALPGITFSKGDDYQRVVASYGGVNGVTSITVTAEDGSQSTYRITFSVEKSANALLEMIYIDGTPIANFSPETLSYRVFLNNSAISVPQITVDKNSGQSVAISAPRLDGIATIEVTPEVGDKNIYTLDFCFQLSSDAYLADITIAGKSIDNFIPQNAEYIVRLNKNESIPTVGYTRNDTKQSVYFHNNGLNQQSHVYVKAENGDVFTYNIHFLEIADSSASINNIYLDGTPLIGFDSDVLSYNINLDNNQSIPSIAVDKAYEEQSVQISVPSNEGTASIIAISEDNNDTLIYTLNFNKAKLSSPYLRGILVDNVNVLSDSAMDTIIVDIPAHHVPTLSVLTKYAQQSAYIADAKLNGANIIVVAQDKSQHKYTIIYNPEKSNISVPADIQYFTAGQYVSLPNFDVNTHKYTIMLPRKSTIVPNINVVSTNSLQTVTIKYAPIGQASQIDVMAQDSSVTSYFVTFATEKDNTSSLAAIYLDGVELSNFSPENTEYTFTLPATQTSAPVVTFDRPMDNDGDIITSQNISVSESGISNQLAVTVVAENSNDSTVYNINLVPTVQNVDNQLRMIKVGNSVVENFRPDVLKYTVTLPYGTESVPLISTTKNYSEQSVIIVAPSLQDSASITVMSNRPGQDNITYKLAFEVSLVNHLMIQTLNVDGTPLASFNPTKTKYVLPISAKPLITYTVEDGVDINILEDSDKALRLEVYSLSSSDVMIYEFFYFYTTDVVPNIDFADFSATTKYNNKSKPTGWMVPADCAESHKVSIIGGGDKYTTGNEVDQYNGKLRLRTWSQRFSINGSLPGMMSLTGMSIQLASSNKSATSVSGGIPFRNTPDVMTVNYNPINKTSGINNLRFIYRTSTDGNTFKEALFTDAIFNNTEKIANIDLKNLDKAPSLINIILNSSNSESAPTLGQTGGSNPWKPETKLESELHISNIAFKYSNNLSAIVINSDTIKLTDNTTTEFNLNMNSDIFGMPIIKAIGEVNDQEHTISTISNNAGGYISTIIVKAENGDERTYTLNIARPQSANTTMQSISVNGQLFSAITDGVDNYTIPVEGLTFRQPEIYVQGFPRQTMTLNYDDYKLNVTVTAENGDQRNFTFTFIDRDINNAQLADITVNTHNINFTPDTYNYTVDITNDAELPLVTYDKNTSTQIVTTSHNIDTVTITSISQNHADTVHYRITFLRASLPTSSILTDIAIAGATIDNFDSNQHHYTISDIINSDYIHFAAGSITDTIIQTIAHNRMSIKVIGSNTNTYILDINHRASSNNDLTAIKLNNNDVAIFNPSIHDYTLDFPRNTSPLLIAESEQSTYLDLEVNNDTIIYIAIAQNNQRDTTHVILSQLKDTHNQLVDILINGQTISLDNEVYTSSHVFSPQTLDYNITLKSDDPKHTQPLMPTISYVSSDSQILSIENNGLNATSFITVRAEDQSETMYSLNIASSKSNNTLLHNVILNFEPLANFSPQIFEYKIDNSSDQLPHIAYTNGDAFQHVIQRQSDNKLELIVVAENLLDTSIYTFNIVSSQLSDNATLANITVNGVQVHNFSPSTHTYDIHLPLGSSPRPDITAYASDDHQTITIIRHSQFDWESPSDTVFINVLAADGTTTAIYALNMSIEQSTNTTLEMIHLNGAPMSAPTGGITISPDFSPYHNDYIVTLPVGTTQLPIITWTTADHYQHVDTMHISLDSVTITVRPQTPGLYNTYQLKFHTLLSSNAELSSIEIDGERISTTAQGFTADANFSADTHTYHITMPVGTTHLPSITWQDGDPYQTTTLIRHSQLDWESSADTAYINVLAQDGTTTAIYTIILTRSLSQNSTLSMISLDNVPLAGFSPDQYLYNHILPLGATQLPIITYERADHRQTVTTTYDTIYSQAQIHVLAEDTTERSTYIIFFTKTKSDNSLLDSIHVDGTPLVGFDPMRFEYTVPVSYGTQRPPHIMPFSSHDSQIISIRPAETITDTTLITVYAENTISVSTYRISFAMLPSSNAHLSAIYLDSVPLTGFSPEILDYDVILPNGTTTLPTISWCGQVLDYQSITLTLGSLNGPSTITVISQDGLMINQYTVNFTVALSSDAQLADLTLFGTTLDGFTPEVFDYTLTYPVGTPVDSLPTPDDIAYTLGHESQNVSISSPDPNTILLTVIAEDATTINVYILNLNILLSSNSLLDAILIDGVLLPTFSPTHYEYSYLLLPGALIPEITVLKGDASQDVTIVLSSVGEPSHIYVTAADGTESEYTILFSFTSSNPGASPTYSDVSWVPLGGGTFKASTLRHNVQVRILSPTGQTLRISDVALIDPNEDITQPHTSGTLLHFEPNPQIYIYVFTHEGKVISSGKFIVTP